MLPVALALALAAGAPAEFHLKSGPAWTANERGVELLIGPRERVVLGEDGFVATGALARARLDLGRVASVEISGRSALEWRPTPEPPGGVDLDLAECDQIEVEVRRGPVWLSLSGGWRVHLERCAVGVRGLSGGRLELVHRAGEPVLLRPRSAGQAHEPPATLLAGARVVLAPDAALPRVAASAVRRVLAPRPALVRSGSGVPSASPRAWAGRRWPWSPGETETARLARVPR